ncbi:MAG: YajD family HNH nuclease [Desulfobacteraceae bacterium]|jgi:hypothetical protein
MSVRITTGKGKLDKVLAEAKEKEKTYRERALKMYPWICAKCTREFDGKRLKELTVHHKDHNHDNNPPDGSNWELLCLYCHDNEHSRDQVADWYGGGSEKETDRGGMGNNPFKGLDALLKLKVKDEKAGE